MYKVACVCPLAVFYGEMFGLLFPIVENYETPTPQEDRPLWEELREQPMLCAASISVEAFVEAAVEAAFHISAAASQDRLSLTATRLEITDHSRALDELSGMFPSAALSAFINIAGLKDQQQNRDMMFVGATTDMLFVGATTRAFLFEAAQKPTPCSGASCLLRAPFHQLQPWPRLSSL